LRKTCAATLGRFSSILKRATPGPELYADARGTVRSCASSAA
jgi:hypothetical protein